MIVQRVAEVFADVQEVGVGLEYRGDDHEADDEVPGQANRCPSAHGRADARSFDELGEDEGRGEHAPEQAPGVGGPVNVRHGAKAQSNDNVEEHEHQIARPLHKSDRERESEK